MTNYLIKQFHEQTHVYWNGKEYVSDRNNAKYFNSRTDAAHEIDEMNKADRYNTVILEDWQS